MSIVIAVINQKGGVGKTTTAVNLSSSISTLGSKVLLIDLDAQTNASVYSAVNLKEITWSIDDVLTSKTVLQQIILKTPFGYDIAPASHSLSGTEWQLMQLDGREFYLKDALHKLNNQYDYIIIDAPPALNILSINAILASTELLIPVQCEFLSLEGLNKLLRTIKALENKMETVIPYRLIRTLFDGRVRLSRQISEELLTHFSNSLCHSIIPRTIRLAESTSHAKPIMYYDPNSQGNLTYLALATELMRIHNKLADFDGRFLEYHDA